MKKYNSLVSDDSVNAILQIASAFEQSKCLLTACELDFFTIIGNDQKTVKEIAISAGTEEKATEKLLNALCSMQLLVKNVNKYSNTKGTRRFLVKSRPEYIGNMMFLTHQWEKWGHLTEAVRTGKAVEFQEINDKSREWVESYVDSIYWRAVMKAPDIVSKINLNGVDSLLDLGCGSAIYAMEFKKAKPTMKVTAFDFPPVILEAIKHINREGFEKDIILMSGDFNKDSFGNKYDAIFISKVMLYSSFWENVGLMRKVYDALNPKGKIIIQETIMNDNKIEPESATLDSLNLLVNTESGDVFSESDIWMILKEGWFTNIKRIDTEFGTSIITAER